MKFIEHRIVDKRLLRITERTLKAGVMEEGCRSRTIVGIPQGAVISPLLGNIYLHYVVDVWAQHWRGKYARGEVYLTRYADDSLMCFQYRSDGEQFKKALQDRLAKYDLSLNDNKTRLIEFGRFAASNRQERGEGKPETFDFLRFTHICSQRRSDGGFTLKRITIAKRQRAKVKSIKETLKRTRHYPVRVVARSLKRAVHG